jgi:hypothetical protein
MARAKKSNSPAGLGHNSGEPLTDDDKADLIALYGDRARRQIRVADEAKAAYDLERTEVNSIFALVKGDLQISRKEFESILAAQDMTEAEFRHAEGKRAGLFKLAGLPMGEQIDLFKHAADTADQAVEAEANGKRAGLRGDDPSPPSTVSPILHPAWMKGWSDGQGELGQRMVRAAALLDARTAAAAPAQPEPEPEEFDADKAARKLKRNGFLERAEADAEAELEPVH